MNTTYVSIHLSGVLDLHFDLVYFIWCTLSGVLYLFIFICIFILIFTYIFIFIFIIIFVICLHVFYCIYVFICLVYIFTEKS